jgi:hypothetical protein
MYSACWQSDLLQALHCAQPADRLCRVTVVGIGHEFGGDDAIGVHVARGSRHRVLPAHTATNCAGQLFAESSAVPLGC